MRKTTFRIDGKHHSGGGEIGANHFLHPDGKRNFAMIETVMDTVSNGPVGKKRCIATSARLEKRPCALHIKIGFLLAGKARLGQVLRSGTAAHRNIEWLAALSAQFGIRLTNRCLNSRRHGCREDEFANFSPPSA